MTPDGTLVRKGTSYPAEGVGVRRDLFGVQEGAEFRLMVLQKQPVQVEGSPFCHTVPTDKKVKGHGPLEMAGIVQSNLQNL